MLVLVKITDEVLMELNFFGGGLMDCISTFLRLIWMFLMLLVSVLQVDVIGYSI